MKFYKKKKFPKEFLFSATHEQYQGTAFDTFIRSRMISLYCG